MPFRPGCSYDTILRLVEQGNLSPESILRGPSTRQFWMLAKHTPGVAHLFGFCHSCHSQVKPDGFACPSCHASFQAERDRQHLGLGPSRPLPGQGMPEVLALRAEPAAQPGLAAAASTSIAQIAPANRSVSSAQSNGGGHESDSMSEVGLQKLVEESTTRAKRWRAAYESQRRQTWIVLVLAAFITVIALVYAIWGPAILANSQSDAISQTGVEFRPNMIRVCSIFW